MPRRIYHMPGQSMYAGAWDVLMLTFDVGCSTGLALKPPGGPSAVAAVAIVAVPAARPCAQARRVVGVKAAADATTRRRPRIATALRGASRLGGLCLCDWVRSLSRVLAGLRCLDVPAMQQRPRTWFRSLAAESWGCNPVLARFWQGEPRLMQAQLAPASAD